MDSPDRLEPTFQIMCLEPEFVNLCFEPWNRFPAWRAGTTTLSDVYRPARLHRLAESIPGFLKRLQIRALDPNRKHSQLKMS